MFGGVISKYISIKTMWFTSSFSMIKLFELFTMPFKTSFSIFLLDFKTSYFNNHSATKMPRSIQGSSLFVSHATVGHTAPCESGRQERARLGAEPVLIEWSNGSPLPQDWRLHPWAAGLPEGSTSLMRQVCAGQNSEQSDMSALLQASPPAPSKCGLLSL